MATTVSARPPVDAGKSVRSSLLDRHHGAPSSPKTPIAGRSISGTFDSPGAYAREEDEIIIYELDPRHLKAGWAGESTPRCIRRFGYALIDNARLGDHSQFTSGRKRTAQKDHVLYETDLRHTDLSLMRAKLERMIRAVHLEFLQIKQKTRRVALIVSPLTPTKILEVALSVLFNHHSQPPSVTLLNTPIMACVGAGLRQGLVIDIGWEETIVSAVSEYCIVAERRSIRGGKALVEAVTDLLRRKASEQSVSSAIDFSLAEDVTTRLAWCASDSSAPEIKSRQISVPLAPDAELTLPFGSFSEVVDSTLFATESTTVPDDNDHGISALAYNVLRGLPRDVRGACADRIVIDGPQSRIPGLRQRVLTQLQSIIDTRGWELVQLPSNQDNFATPRQGSPVSGSEISNARVAPSEASSQIQPTTEDESSTEASSTTASRPTSSGALTGTMEALAIDDGTTSPQGGRQSLTNTLNARAIPAGLRPQDDAKDPVTQRAERESIKRRLEPFSGKVRGVESLGAWAGASMAMSLRVKGVCEIEREDFLKHGLRDSASLLI